MISLRPGIDAEMSARLASQSVRMRLAAVGVLFALPDGAGLEGLVRALGDTVVEVRVAAVQALGSRGPESLVNVLLSARPGDPVFCERAVSDMKRSRPTPEWGRFDLLRHCRRLAADPAQSESIRRAARAVLDPRHPSKTLLRPAKSPFSPAEVLLRPAHGVPGGPHELLLRPADPERDVPQEQQG